MSKILTFEDSYKLVLPNTFADTQQLISETDKRIGLRTITRATHSGALLNQRVYPGIRMRDSVGSWITPERGGSASFNKPILVNHDQEDANAAIGRVRGAQYTQLKHGDEFMYDFKRPATGRNHGSGFITLEGLVTDKDAIEKIIDGRYQTVSTGQRPDAALCNICGFDWLSDSNDAEPCEHRPGRKYQIEDVDYPCYLVTGKLEFRECSYVNVPAQQNARTLSANLEALEGLWSGDSDNDGVFRSFGDSADTVAFDLFDTEGNQLDLILRDGDDDCLPDIATRFTKTKVSVPELEDTTMKKGEKGQKMTTDDADQILDSWIKDSKETVADASKTKDEDDNADQDIKDEVKDDSDTADDTKDTVVKDDVQNDEEKRISDKALAEAIDRLTEERDALKAENEELKGQLDEKNELSTTLTESLAAMRKSSTTDAARQLALIRVITGHTGTEDAGTSSDGFDQLVKDLSDRSVDSLNDAIKDSLPQLQDVLHQLRSNDASDVRVVTDPTLHREEKDGNVDDNGEDDGETKDTMQSKDDFLSKMD